MNPADLARALPDQPNWLELRAMLLCDDARLFGDPVRGDFVVVTSWLMGVHGRPAPGLLLELDRQFPQLDLLAPLEADALVRDTLPWRVVGHAQLWLAPLHPAPVPCPSYVRLGWLEGEGTSHVAPGLRAELAAAQRRCRVAAAWSGELPIAFCFAPWETEGLYDLSVDTVPDFRRRGVATALASFYVGERRDKRAVWAAVEGNTASQRVAQKLGFTPAGALVVAEGA